jgi:methyl-accepting chemotaxis protein WspA
MKNLSIRQRVIASFALVLALMLAMAAITYQRLHRVQEEVRSMETDSLPGLQTSYAMLVTISDLESLFEQHARESDVAEMGALAQRLPPLHEQLGQQLLAYEATIFRDRDRALFTALQEAYQAYRAMEEPALAASLAAGARGASTPIQGTLRATEERLSNAAKALVDFNGQNAKESQRQIQREADATENALLGSSALALGLSLFFGWNLLRAISQPLNALVGAVNQVRLGDFTRRLRLERRDEFGILAEGFDRMSEELVTLVGQVQHSGIKVDSSVNEIAATAKEQQATAAEIAASTSEIGATAREITATSRELVKTMTEVSGSAERSAALAGSSQAGIARMEQTMRHVTEAAGVINAKLAVLSEKAGNISQMVTTITKVADQTNLLSLNASIEAEKAGEYGRGFAVVATEIRRLADQTAVATYDIEQMVKEIQSAVAAGVMGMDKFSEEVRRGMSEIQEAGAQLSQLIQQVQGLAPRFDEVSEGMRAQATGAEQISQALSQLGEASQQTADSLRLSTQAIDQLTQVAGGLRGGVSRFKLEHRA